MRTVAATGCACAATGANIPATIIERLVSITLLPDVKFFFGNDTPKKSDAMRGSSCLTAACFSPAAVNR